MGAGLEFKPRILGFLCNWCCYGGADLLWSISISIPPLCKGDKADVLGTGRPVLHTSSLSNGTDGVFIGGCHLNDCHYNTEGNYDALNVMHLSKRLLEHAGVSPDRLRLEWVSAGEGTRFAEVMNDFGRQVKQLGPLGKSEGIEQDEIKTRIAEITKFGPVH